LFGKAQKLACFSEVSVLSGGGGRKGPARSASSLVLDGVYTTLGSPIETVSGRSEVLEVLLGGKTTSVSEDLLELLLGPGGEHVVTNGKGVLWV